MGEPVKRRSTRLPHRHEAATLRDFMDLERRIENANRTMDQYAKGIVCEPVRTSFDDVYPGMPPAVKLSA